MEVEGLAKAKKNEKRRKRDKRDECFVVLASPTRCRWRGRSRGKVREAGEGGRLLSPCASCIHSLPSQPFRPWTPTCGLNASKDRRIPPLHPLLGPSLPARPPPHHLKRRAVAMMRTEGQGGCRCYDEEGRARRVVECMGCICTV